MSAKGKENKPHIGIFGRRNNGKSSLINALTGQETAIVSEVPGTTTDPVKKSMEIPGIGAVVLLDTAGIDDLGELGLKRIGKSLDALKTIDLGILLITGNQFGEEEKQLITAFNEQEVPFIIIHNKSDIQALKPELARELVNTCKTKVLDFSALQHPDLTELIEIIRLKIPESACKSAVLVGDLISYGDVVLLITPIDIEAPEGRMILPQVQVIRDVLDHDGIAVVCKEREVDTLIRTLNPRPKLVVTDSQVFPKADASIPKDIMLTSFSVVLARQKGTFEDYLKGTPTISKLNDGDKVLILESCSHHVSCDDIGRVKLPRWISNFTGKQLHFQVVPGLDKLPDDLSSFSLVVQCGGCVITRKQVQNRIRQAIQAGIPVTNYGMTIAYVHGIYNRAIAPFTRGSDQSIDYL
ncbi:MAG: [FeFe] hydrogenase H-cluster maturation GTPase HydF [Bacteroidetes bacterium]|nr:[FeFe] hydrogenase H-cluster maturation GTPase HydF [Bacteroidota bacterium]